MSDFNKADSGFSPLEPLALLQRMEDDRKLREEEARIRYAARKEEKAEHRQKVEQAVVKICDMVQMAAERNSEHRRLEEITALAAALNHATAAMQMAEGYAESRPM